MDLLMDVVILGINIQHNQDRINIGPKKNSRIETSESIGSLDDHLLDFELFNIELVPNYLSDIIIFLTISVVPQGYLKT
jgi:hypothetical protein